MRERWLILTVLTFARTVMGFQFQSVAAVSPFLLDQFQLSYAALGSLIGLYLLPGVAVAEVAPWYCDRSRGATGIRRCVLVAGGHLYDGGAHCLGLGACCHLLSSSGH